MKGFANWTTGYHNGAGFIRWSPSVVNGTAVSGSFAGAATFAVSVPSSWAAICQGERRIPSARISGKFTFAPVCPPGEDPVTSGPITLYTIGGESYCATSIASHRPSSITTGPDGALWFTANYMVGRMTTSGAITNTYPVSGTDIITGPDGNLWFIGQNAIDRMTTSGVVTSYRLSSTDVPQSITVGPDGALWFTNVVTGARGLYAGSSIGRITTSGSVTMYTDPSLYYPGSITSGPDGALWFTISGYWSDNGSGPFVGGSIGRITTAGRVSTFSNSNIVNLTGGIVAGPDGALWFADGQTIGRITTSGQVTTYADPIGGTLTDSQAMTVGPDGALWFTNWGSDSGIGRITTSGVLTVWSDPSVLYPGDPAGITAGPDGALWFVNQGSDSIGRITTP